MIARHLNDGAAPGRRRDAEPIPFPLDDQHRDRDLVELGEAARRFLAPFPPRRLQGKGETEDGDGGDLTGGAAGHPCAERAPAHDKWQPTQLAGAQMLEHRGPGGVELVCWSGGATTGDAVGLLDKRDAHILWERGIGRRHQISRLDPSPGAVAENQGGSRAVGRMQVRPRRAVRRLDLDRGQAPWHFLYFLPEPHQQGSLRPIFSRSSLTTVSCS